MDLKQFLNEKKDLVDNHLPTYIEKLSAPEVLKEAMLYSLNAGGKRLRPILLFATLEGFKNEAELGLDVACALEIIHTYSLIHDDLPSMDDDDIRRGNPTNHIVFGEAQAILAGDGLLTIAFEIISKMESAQVSPEMKLQIISALANAAGPEGMVGGQVADLAAETKSVPLSELESIHLNKTGRLLTFPIEAAAFLSNANEGQVTNLRQFAMHLGLAFQIKDDILDIEGDEKLLGKPVGSDVTNQKSTYPSLLTLAGAKEKCNHHLNEAKKHLRLVDIDTELLESIADYIVQRNH